MSESRPGWLLAVMAAVLFCTAFALSHWVDTLWEQADDAYITYQYARRVAAGERFTFTPGAEPSFGTTTPLWTLILAGAARVGVPPHVAAPWLTSLGHGATAVLVLLVGSAIGGLALGLPAGAMAALSFSVFFRAGGMETALVTTLSAALGYVLVRGKVRWWPGVLLGLLFLARPDTALLAAVVFAGWALRRETRREVLLPNLVAAAVVCLPWLAYSLWTFHDVIPWSLRAKAMVRGSGEMNLGTFRQWFVGEARAPVFWAAAGICAIGGVAVWVRERRFRPFIVWSGLYCWALPAGGAPDFLWYYIPPLWVGFILVTAGLRAMAFLVPRRGRMPAYVLAAAVVVSGYALLSHRGVVQELRPNNPYPNFHVMLARELAKLAEPGDMVAAPEVGCIAYYSGCRVLDIRATTSPETIMQARARNLGAMLRHWKPEFVVILEGKGNAEIQHAYTDRFRAPYWNGMDYVIWERTLESERGADRPGEGFVPISTSEGLAGGKEERFASNGDGVQNTHREVAE